MKKFLWIAALLAAFALVFTGCPEDGNKDNKKDIEKFDVTFDLNGVAGTPPAKQTIEKGKTAARPATNPSATGFTFVNWFETPVTAENVESASPFNFSTPINAAKTLYAGWKLDTANYYFVSFYSDPADEHAYRVVPVANDNQSKAAAPSPAPTKTGYTLLGWTTEDEPDIDSVKYDFNTLVIKNFDLYAIWEKNIDVSDIILINEGKGVLEDDFFNVLVRYEDKPAIKIIPNTEISPSMDSYKEYRMTFTFNPSFDITQYGQIDLDIVSDGADPGVVVVSLFMGEDGEERPEKVMVETSTMGGASIVLGDKLHFKSKQLQSIELWASPMLENSPNLYVRKLGVSGTAIPDPEVGTPIPATGIFMAYTKDAASGQKILPLTPGTDGITHEDIKRIYVHFDPLGQDFAAIDIKFTKNAPQGGGNMNIKSAVDASGELQFTGGNDYLGWFGWANEPFYFADPSTINPAVDKATLRAIGFDFQVDAATPTLELLSVTFLPKGAEPPKDPDPVDELEGQWVKDVSVTLESIIKVTGVSAAAAGGEISAVELGKLNGVPAVRVLPAEEDKAIRAVFEVAAPYDISGYGKAVLTWQGPPTSSTYVNNGMDIEGVVDPAWVMIRNTGTSPLDILFTQDSPWGSKPLMTTSLKLNGFEIYVDQSKMAAFYILGYEFDTYTPPGGGTDDGDWIVTGIEDGTTMAPNNTVSGTGDADWFVYIYFPPRAAGIAQIVLDYETTGGIALTKQCVYDATGTWGWGWGDVANGSPLDLSGGQYWGASGTALDTTTLKGICIKIAGAGTFKLNGVTITEMAGGGNDDEELIDMVANFPDDMSNQLSGAGVVNANDANVTAATGKAGIYLSKWGSGFDASEYVGLKFEYKATHTGNFYIDTGDSTAWSSGWDVFQVKSEWTEVIVLFDSITGLRSTDGKTFNPNTIYKLAFEIYDGPDATLNIRNLSGIKGEGGASGPFVIFDGSAAGFLSGVSLTETEFAIAEAGKITLKVKEGGEKPEFRCNVIFAAGAQKDLTAYSKFKMEWTSSTSNGGSFNITLKFPGGRLLNAWVGKGTASFDFVSDNPGWASGWGDAAVGTITELEIFSDDGGHGNGDILITKIWFE